VILIEALGCAGDKLATKPAFQVEIRQDQALRFVPNRKWNISEALLAFAGANGGTWDRLLAFAFSAPTGLITDFTRGRAHRQNE
jgi:hypothetical protein